MRLSARPTFAAVSASAVLLLSVFLAGCGQSSNVAGASATPTCPARTTAATKSVTGTIASVGSGSLSVAQADGTTATVHLDSNTRITKFSIVTSSAITTGAHVSVVADTAVTTAKDVILTPAGATIGGGNGFGRGRGAGTGTPTTRVNRSCFPTRTPGTPGAGRPGGGTGGIGNFTQGLLGNTSGYQGLNGTVDSITPTKLTFDDPQGQTFSVALTPATMILMVGPGKTTDLAQGEKALASGTPTSGGITARNLIVIPASVSAS